MGLLAGKTALITGSGRGIGRAAAELFVREGASVLINDLDPDLVSEVEDDLAGSAAGHAGDLTGPGECERLIDAANREFGRLDIVVNNAGYLWDGVVHKMSDEQFQAMLDIHTVVPFRIIRALAPEWRRAAKAEAAAGESRFRKIVNVTSVSGTMGSAAQANYASAKAAVTGLTKSVAKEWGPLMINCNAVAFGTMDTRLTQAIEKGEMRAAPGRAPEIPIGVPEAIRRRNLETIPFGRPGSPLEGAGPILFLASSLSDYVQGQVLTVSGGKMAGMSA